MGAKDWRSAFHMQGDALQLCIPWVAKVLVPQLCQELRLGGGGSPSLDAQYAVSPGGTNFLRQSSHVVTGVHGVSVGGGIVEAIFAFQQHFY